MEDERRQKHNNIHDVFRVEVGYKQRISVSLLTWAEKPEVANPQRISLSNLRYYLSGVGKETCCG